MAEITNEQQQTYPDDKIAQELVINVKKEDTARDTTKEEDETNEKEKDHQASSAIGQETEDINEQVNQQKPKTQIKRRFIFQKSSKKSNAAEKFFEESLATKHNDIKDTKDSITTTTTTTTTISPNKITAAARKRFGFNASSLKKTNKKQLKPVVVENEESKEEEIDEAESPCADEKKEDTNETVEKEEDAKEGVELIEKVYTGPPKQISKGEEEEGYRGKEE